MASIRTGMATLEAFAEKYPQLHPFTVSPLMPSIHCSSSDILTCRDLFGSDGWETHTHSISKDVEGVRVQVELPREYRPFSFGKAE